MKPPKYSRLGEPPSHTQNFIDVKLKLICCRYWIMDLWDCHDMAFPYWRIYWNKNLGGELKFQKDIFEMDPEHLYIIPPFTSFTSSFVKRHLYDSGIHASAESLTNTHNEADYIDSHLFHFFTHFNLGVPFDNVFPGIYKIKLDRHQKLQLIYLTNQLKMENTDFKLTFNLRLQSFIKATLSNIGPQLWKAINIDIRVLKVVRYVEANIQKKMNNPDLAKIVKMAPNSFARLFKDEMGVTLNSFIRKRKIAFACDLFDLSEKTIEEVTFELGFSDRNHFSRVFKSITGVSPGVYKTTKFFK